MASETNEGKSPSGTVRADGGDGKSVQGLSRITRNELAGVVTIGALAGFVAFVVYLLVEISAGETNWARRTYLFSAVEAITFAGVGWLFGKEVHRERAETAEKKAGAEEAKAEKAATVAAAKSEEAVKYQERGLSLKSAIRAAQQGHQQLAPHLRQNLGAAGDSLASTAGTQLDQLAAQADQLFPDN